MTVLWPAPVRRLVLLGAVLADSHEVHAEECGGYRQLGQPHVERENGILARSRRVQQEGCLGEQPHQDAVDGQVQLGKSTLVHANGPRGHGDCRHP